jgi:membrane protein DedA with SNARE-associated domain
MRNEAEPVKDEVERGTSADAPGWRRWVPWQGPATRADAALLAAIGGVILFGFAVRAARPFLIASHPVLLEFLNGGAAEIGAAAAYARVGELPLWLVVVAGTVGMMKLDWLTWWAGRRWGPGIVGYFTTRDRADRLTDQARRLAPWMLRVGVVAAGLPGVPSALVTALAGWTRMRLPTFLALDALGALLATSLVTALGYLLGQRAIDVVLLVERYAGWVTLGIVVATLGWPFIRRMLRARA